MFISISIVMSGGKFGFFASFRIVFPSSSSMMSTAAAPLTRA